MFFGLGPRLQKVVQSLPPSALAPWEAVRLPRTRGPGELAATWFPAISDPRGAVLFLHPWFEWGKDYFYRRGRLEAVRAAGYHALTVDLPGFGSSGPRRGFLDLDVADALSGLAAQAGALPLFVWGVSAGGYWAHHVLAAAPGRARAAVFEDVSPHLIEWSRRSAPWGRPAFALFERLFRQSYGFLDARRHASHLAIPTLHVSGADDRGVRPADTVELARLAGGRHLVVPGAGHLGSIRLASDEICALAVETFALGS